MRYYLWQTPRGYIIQLMPQSCRYVGETSIVHSPAEAKLFDTIPDQYVKQTTTPTPS